MTVAASESPSRPSALANFAAIMIRPRVTMRRILDAGRDRMILPLILLTTVSAVIGDFDRSALIKLRELPVPLGLLVPGLCISVAAFFLLMFYVVSWLVFGIGRLLEGTATPREVRSALAWGFAPIIWAILYRLPAVILWPGEVRSRVGLGSENLTLDPGLMGIGCIGMVIFGALELTMLVWYAVVMSNTVAEANRFSTARGFGTLVLAGITPGVIAIAAFLAS